MRKNATIIDIARECCLSKSTVAYALNPQDCDKVSEKSRKKVFSAAEYLDYAPNIAARSLRANRTYSIGVMLPQPADYFYGALSMELQKVLWSKGYTAFFSFWDGLEDAASVKKNYEKLLPWNVDGIITCELEGVFPLETEKPFVFYQPMKTKNYDAVYVDSSVIIDGIKILKDKGYSKFALIAPEGTSNRKEAFFEAIRIFNLEKNPAWIFYGRGARTMGRDGMKHFLSLDNKPTAIIGHNDPITISAMNEAQRQGVKIPDEMAFMGFDDIEEAAFSLPSLTTFKVPLDKLAKTLTETLLERIDSPEKKITNKIIKPELIIRNSI